MVDGQLALPRNVHLFLLQAFAYRLSVSPFVLHAGSGSSNRPQGPVTRRDARSPPLHSPPAGDCSTMLVLLGFDSYT